MKEQVRLVLDRFFMFFSATHLNLLLSSHDSQIMIIYIIYILCHLLDISSLFDLVRGLLHSNFSNKKISFLVLYTIESKSKEKNVKIYLVEILEEKGEEGIPCSQRKL